MGNTSSSLPEEEEDEVLWRKFYVEIAHSSSVRSLIPLSFRKNAHVVASSERKVFSWIGWRNDEMNYIFGVEHECGKGQTYLYLKPKTVRGRRTELRLRKGKLPNKSEKKDDRRIFKFEILPQDPDRNVLIHVRSQKYLVCDDVGRVMLTRSIIKSQGWILNVQDAPTSIE